MNDPYQKLVEFEKYCKICKHEKVKDHDEPCNECLDNPVNYSGSRKPMNWEEKEK